jgi:hypothetical protein
MKLIAVTALIVVSAGCTSSHPASIIGENSFGKPERPPLKLATGEYEVEIVPGVAIVYTNTPTLWNYQCARLRVDSIPYERNVKLETRIDFPGGRVSTSVAGPEVTQKADVTVWSDGTNIFVSVSDGMYPYSRYRVAVGTNGTVRLVEVNK